MGINWADDNILKINNEIDCFTCGFIESVGLKKFLLSDSLNLEILKKFLLPSP
jgi:hypothetical protein